MTDKPIPMTTEEEYRNADVPLPNDLLNASNTEQFKIDKSKMIETQQKEIRDLVKDNKMLIAEIDRLRSQIERLKNLIVNENK
mgnify:FL=1|tara:strand:- start:723 stop:971 length:249 start_codon:yes stop_codon:yes gene_type:complete